MNDKLKKWNPFKFLRATDRTDRRDMSDRASASQSPSESKQDIARLFPGATWRAIEEFLHDSISSRGPLDRWFGDYSSSRFQPRIDVVDEGRILRVSVELPGVKKEDLNVTAEDGAIVLRGEKSQDARREENGCYRLERAYGYFERVIPMPEDSDADRTLAKFDNGLLILTVPKRESLEGGSRKIDIS